MPALTRRLPRYCHHKATNRAVVYLDGKAVYLGPFDSPESKARYKAVIAEWLAQRALDDKQPEKAAAPDPRPLTVTQLALRFKRHSESYYKGSREVDNLRDAIRPARALFGRWLASEFGPTQLRRVREEMVKADLSRSVINSRVNRIRRMFKWAVAEELIRPDVLDRLRALEPLRHGRGGKEHPPIRPVAWKDVEAILPHLPEMVRAMVLFGWHTGARPAEITTLTTGMIDQSGDVWVARFASHKTAHHGATRELLIGPKAQSALAPWLLPKKTDEPVFSPRRVDDRQARRRGRRLPGRYYSRCGFAQVVARACDRAGIPIWTPNRLRHAAATRLRDLHGIEAAQVALGHARPDTTLIYSSAARARALEAIKLVG
jgi:integrase